MKISASVFVLLFFSSFAFSQSYDEIVVIEGSCSFEFKPIGADGPIEKYVSRISGRGFLVGHKKNISHENKEYVVTAGHITSCKPRPEDFWGYDVLSFNRSGLFVIYQGIKYESTVLKEFFEVGNLEKGDQSLVSFLMPKNLKHKHFSLAPANLKYNTGDNVYAQGFLYFGFRNIEESQQWKRVFQQGKIVDIDKLYIHLGFMVYPGMSGSPLIIEKRNKFIFWTKKKYAIGVVSRSLSAPTGERVPYSFAGRINQESF